MPDQATRAIEPRLPLERTISEWNRISEALAEPPRQRALQIANCFSKLGQTS